MVVPRGWGERARATIGGRCRKVWKMIAKRSGSWTKCGSLRLMVGKSGWRWHLDGKRGNLPRLLL